MLKKIHELTTTFYTNENVESLKEYWENVFKVRGVEIDHGPTWMRRLVVGVMDMFEKKPRLGKARPVERDGIGKPIYYGELEFDIFERIRELKESREDDEVSTHAPTSSGSSNKDPSEADEDELNLETVHPITLSYIARNSPLLAIKDKKYPDAHDVLRERINGRRQSRVLAIEDKKDEKTEIPKDSEDSEPSAPAPRPSRQPRRRPRKNLFRRVATAAAAVAIGGFTLAAHGGVTVPNLVPNFGPGPAVSSVSDPYSRTFDKGPSEEFVGFLPYYNGTDNPVQDFNFNNSKLNHTNESDYGICLNNQTCKWSDKFNLNKWNPNTTVNVAPKFLPNYNTSRVPVPIPSNATNGVCPAPKIHNPICPKPPSAPEPKPDSEPKPKKKKKRVCRSKKNPNRDVVRVERTEEEKQQIIEGKLRIKLTEIPSCEEVEVDDEEEEVINEEVPTTTTTTTTTTAFVPVPEPEVEVKKQHKCTTVQVQEPNLKKPESYSEKISTGLKSWFGWMKRGDNKNEGPVPYPELLARKPC